MAERKIDLHRMFDVESSLNLDRIEALEHWENDEVNANNTLIELRKIISNIKDELTNPDYTTTEDYINLLVHDKDTYELEMGYLMRRRLETLAELVELDIFQIEIECKSYIVAPDQGQEMAN